MKFIQKTTAFLLVLIMVSPILALTETRKTLTEDQKILHVLNRLSFGTRPGDVEKVKAIGLKKYIEQQLNANAINDSQAESKFANLEVMNLSTTELFVKFPNTSGILRNLEQQGKIKAGTVDKSEADGQMSRQNPSGMRENMSETGSAEDRAERQERRQVLQDIYQKHGFKSPNLIPQQIGANRVMRAVYSEKQLQEVMVDFWQNHFNVYSGKTVLKWYIPSYERDVIRKNALGNFKDLLVGTAQHPAMLVYLDNNQSISPTAQSGNRQPPQRPQRPQGNAGMPTPMGERPQGLNENYARELMELHTLGVNGGYTQQDIIEVAKCFTGWTVADWRGFQKLNSVISGNSNARMNPGIPSDVESGEFYFNRNWHDNGDKTVLGNKIKAEGMNDGLQVLDILVKHPSTAKFIARKLVIKFVSDSPSEALIDRIAEAFSKSNGDIKTTLRVLFNDEEFFAPENYRAKIKSPFELAVSSIRALGAETDSNPMLLGLLNKMGEIPYGYQAPTGYGDTAEMWVNTGALIERLNFAIVQVKP